MLTPVVVLVHVPQKTWETIETALDLSKDEPSDFFTLAAFRHATAVIEERSTKKGAIAS